MLMISIGYREGNETMGAHMRTLRGKFRDLKSAANLWMDVKDARSRWMMCRRALGVSFSNWAFTVSAFVMFLAARIICAPRLASTRAVSNPFPDVGPVMCCNLTILVYNHQCWELRFWIRGCSPCTLENITRYVRTTPILAHNQQKHEQISWCSCDTVLKYYNSKFWSSTSLKNLTWFGSEFWLTFDNLQCLSVHVVSKTLILVKWRGGVWLSTMIV